MSAAEILDVLVRTNLALGAGVLLVLALRRPVRALGGARSAYALWLAAPLAALAVLVPARTVTVMVSETAPAPREAPAPTPAPTPRPAPSDAAPAIRVPEIEPAEALVAAWALAALLALGVQAARQHRFVRSLGRLRDEGGVFHAEHVQAGPAVIGALLPRLVLPADFATRFTREEQALVLAHERNHLAVGDAQINAVVAVLQGLFWFNPLVHLAARGLRVDQEIACDAAVLARFPAAARAYGEAMLKTQLAPHAPPLGCHWPASAKGQLKERFAMLGRYRAGRVRRVMGAGAVSVLVLGGAVAAWAAQPARVTHEVAAVEDGPRARNPGDAPLLEAVRSGDARAVAALLDAGADPNQVWRGDGTALIEAARRGRADLVALLLDHRADPNLMARGDGSPLIGAVRSGRTEVVELLLARGADAGLAVRGDGDPLIAAAADGRLDLVRMLVAHGARIESFVPNDETPLINAARSGDVATVAYLVELGADVNRAVPANDGARSPLSEALRLHRDQVAAYLRSKGARA